MWTETRPRRAPTRSPGAAQLVIEVLYVGQVRPGELERVEREGHGIEHVRSVAAGRQALATGRHGVVVAYASPDALRWLVGAGVPAVLHNGDDVVVIDHLGTREAEDLARAVAALLG